MKGNAEQFNAALREFAVKVVPEKARDVTRAIALEGLRRIVQKTPVDTGHARAGWQVTLDTQQDGVALNLDKSGANTIRSGSAVINHAVARADMPRIFISNNVEYIEILEDGRLEGEAAGEGRFVPQGGVYGLMGRVRRLGARGSMQAPNGMLGVTFAELVAMLDTSEGEA
jgi:hypothetical protein